MSKHGFWLLVAGREYFLPFKEFPWFEDAPIRQLMNVQLLHSRHLYWPGLDIDLSLDSIEHPERFPLISRWRSANQARLGGTTQRSSATPRRRKAQ
ncbi:MAG: DUF2442 domain-containing protein [Candidatus Acidiferrales bacterium]